MKPPYTEKQKEMLVWMYNQQPLRVWCWVRSCAALRGLAQRKTPLVEFASQQSASVLGLEIQARLTSAGVAEVASLKMHGLVSGVAP